MRKKHGKIDICHVVIFRLFCLMARFVPIIRVYFCLLIITAIHWYHFYIRTWIWEQWRTLKVIVKNNFEIFKKLEK